MPQANQTAALAAKAILQQSAGPSVRQDLDSVEFQMALEAQNLARKGFDAAVRRAAEATGAEFLFNIPAPSSLPFQRAALVRLPETSRQIVLVTLSGDGVKMEAQEETPDTAHLFRLGEAWLAVSDQFRKLS